jgi:hypothetical protein
MRSIPQGISIGDKIVTRACAKRNSWADPPQAQ